MGEVIDCKTLGSVLRKFREERQLSQEALADKAGLHRTYIGGVERGERNPSFESISRIVHGLGINWTDLGKELDREEKSTRDETGSIN